MQRQLAAISIAAWFADKRIAAVWFGFACGVCLVLLIALQMDHSVREASKAEVLSPEAAALRVLVAAQTKSQRAWISIRPRLHEEVKIGNPVNVELIFENVGKEPATGVNHHGMAMVFDTPTQVGYAPAIWTSQFEQVIRLEADLANPTPGKMTIFPGTSVMIKIEWKNLETIASLISGKKILVVYGATGYTTQHESHHTWYCFYLKRSDGGQWQLGSAPIGNDAD